MDEVIGIRKCCKQFPELKAIVKSFGGESDFYFQCKKCGRLYYRDERDLELKK